MQCSRMCDEPGHPRCALYAVRKSRMRLHIVDDNKTKIAKSGALVPLTRLARSKDMRVQRNATGALLNMTHSGQPSVKYRPWATPLINDICRREPAAVGQCWSDPSSGWSSQLPRYGRPILLHNGIEQYCGRRREQKEVGSERAQARYEPRAAHG